ncbi:apoptosis-stimulating of p53 protein 2-like [Notothenia coriiceps]|uniref:Apoptosis-stimulating of p53 protein 2-like n=1 Tax=Notothenia coriiceps TaxID=8208 RepID=A0A6I9N374_9TELE|nr:PREDICTED: apoptosis-stimulating of p53 protein 2-like [Notothenia coriiceps]
MRNKLNADQSGRHAAAGADSLNKRNLEVGSEWTTARRVLAATLERRKPQPARRKRTCRMFLTVYLSNNDQHFNEVPITPETLCRDVVELCKEPGEGECYLAEMWRGSEHIVGDGERMFEVLQKCGQQRGEVRYLLRHQRAPGRESGDMRLEDSG